MDYPAIIFDKSDIKKYINGLSVHCTGKEVNPTVSNVRAYTEAGLFLGIGSVSIDNGNMVIKSEKLLAKCP